MHAIWLYCYDFLTDLTFKGVFCNYPRQEVNKTFTTSGQCLASECLKMVSNVHSCAFIFDVAIPTISPRAFCSSDVSVANEMALRADLFFPFSHPLPRTFFLLHSVCELCACAGKRGEVIDLYINIYK